MQTHIPNIRQLVKSIPVKCSLKVALLSPRLDLRKPWWHDANEGMNSFGLYKDSAGQEQVTRENPG